MLPFHNYYISTPITSEKKNIFSSHTDRRKIMRWPPTLFTGGERHGGCRGGGGEEDELAAVKAAAWAWYQRNEGKPMMREFDLTTRASRTPQPSRYKLEANKNMILSENKVHCKSHKDHLSRGDQETKCSNLLDPYEMNSISKRIDESNSSSSSLPAKQDGVFRYDHGHHQYDQKKVEYGSKKEINGFVKKVSIRNLWKGFILMAPTRTVCGRSDDVDHRAYSSGPRTVKVAPTLVNTRNNHR